MYDICNMHVLCTFCIVHSTDSIEKFAICFLHQSVCHNLKLISPPHSSPGRAASDGPPHPAVAATVPRVAADLHVAYASLPQLRDHEATRRDGNKRREHRMRSIDRHHFSSDVVQQRPEQLGFSAVLDRIADSLAGSRPPR